MPARRRRGPGRKPGQTGRSHPNAPPGSRDGGSRSLGALPIEPPHHPVRPLWSRARHTSRAPGLAPGLDNRVPVALRAELSAHMSSRRILILFVAIALAGVAAFSTYNYVSSADDRAAADAALVPIWRVERTIP